MVGFKHKSSPSPPILRISNKQVGSITQLRLFRGLQNFEDLLQLLYPEFGFLRISSPHKPWWFMAPKVVQPFGGNLSFLSLLTQSLAFLFWSSSLSLSFGLGGTGIGLLCHKTSQSCYRLSHPRHVVLHGYFWISSWRHLDLQAYNTHRAYYSGKIEFGSDSQPTHFPSIDIDR